MKKLVIVFFAVSTNVAAFGNVVQFNATTVPTTGDATLLIAQSNTIVFDTMITEALANGLKSIKVDLPCGVIPMNSTFSDALIKIMATGCGSHSWFASDDSASVIYPMGFDNAPAVSLIRRSSTFKLAGVDGTGAGVSVVGVAIGANSNVETNNSSYVAIEDVRVSRMTSHGIVWNDGGHLRLQRVQSFQNAGSGVYLTTGLGDNNHGFFSSVSLSFNAGWGVEWQDGQLNKVNRNSSYHHFAYVKCFQNGTPNVGGGCMKVAGSSVTGHVFSEQSYEHSPDFSVFTQTGNPSILFTETSESNTFYVSGDTKDPLYIVDLSNSMQRNDYSYGHPYFGVQKKSVSTEHLILKGLKTVDANLNKVEHTGGFEVKTEATKKVVWRSHGNGGNVNMHFQGKATGSAPALKLIIEDEIRVNGVLRLDPSWNNPCDWGGSWGYVVNGVRVLGISTPTDTGC